MSTWVHAYSTCPSSRVKHRQSKCTLCCDFQGISTNDLLNNSHFFHVYPVILHMWDRDTRLWVPYGTVRRHKIPHHNISNRARLSASATHSVIRLTFIPKLSTYSGWFLVSWWFYSVVCACFGSSSCELVALPGIEITWWDESPCYIPVTMGRLRSSAILRNTFTVWRNLEFIIHNTLIELSWSILTVIMCCHMCHMHCKVK